MAGWTNRGTYTLMRYLFNALALPTSFYCALVKSTPTDATNVMSDLTEVAAGNGYTSGGGTQGQLAKNATDFPSVTEDDANHKSTIKVKNLTWTAAGGYLPTDQAGATYMVLLDDNATVGSRIVFAFWSLGGARFVSDGQQLQINNAELDLVNT